MGHNEIGMSKVRLMLVLFNNHYSGDNTTAQHGWNTINNSMNRKPIC